MLADLPPETGLAREPLLMKTARFKAIVTDLHFWVPIVVLMIGLGLLLILS